MLFLLALCECGREERGGECFETGLDNSLRVQFAADAPGCFEAAGCKYGYCTELLGAYADNSGLSLEIGAGIPVAGLWKNIENNATDIAVVLTSQVRPDALAVQVGTTRYVMLGRGFPEYPGSLSAVVGEGTVSIVPGFQTTEAYDALLDSLSAAKLYVSPRGCWELAGEVARGKCDFLICERSDALMASEFFAGLEVVYGFDEEVGLSLAFPASKASLFGDFSRWWENYGQSGGASELQAAYFGEYAGSRIGRLNRNARKGNGISVWDDLIRKVGEREDVDWRLLSAIAYKESRFMHNVTSGKGATGLMQIMPVTARHFKVEQADLSDPEVNITLAAKLIKSIGRTLGFSSSVPTGDRLSIILAAYNCGIGTVADARRLAAAQGWNPDSWGDVSQCLELMGDSSYRCDSVTFRKFRGCGETLAFVDGVRKKYDAYRRAVD